jgi:hypothetical protein
MSEQEREFSGQEERDAGSEEPDVEAHKRKAFEGGPELEEDDGDDVEAHRRR